MNASQAAILILNGNVAVRDDVRAAIHTLRQQGTRIDVGVTYEGSDAARFAQDLDDGEYNVVIAGGTVNEIASGLLATADSQRPRAPLAIVPLGTANDLARCRRCRPRSAETYPKRA